MPVNANYERIYKVVNAIPKGCVCSYGKVADYAGLPGRARLVGKSLGEVKTDMKVNWHRVVRSNGQLAFDKGSRQSLLQSTLLREEGVLVNNNRINMHQFEWRVDLATMLLGFEH